MYVLNVSSLHHDAAYTAGREDDAAGPPGDRANREGGIAEGFEGFSSDSDAVSDPAAPPSPSNSNSNSNSSSSSSSSSHSASSMRRSTSRLTSGPSMRATSSGIAPLPPAAAKSPTGPWRVHSRRALRRRGHSRRRWRVTDPSERSMMRHAGERRSRRGTSIATSSSASHRVSSRCQTTSAATRAHEDAGLEDDDDDDDDASSSSDGRERRTRAA